jgi:hypothetical protein
MDQSPTTTINMQFSLYPQTPTQVEIAVCYPKNGKTFSALRANPQIRSKIHKKDLKKHTSKLPLSFFGQHRLVQLACLDHIYENNSSKRIPLSFIGTK